MKITVTKGLRADRIEIHRRDGSAARTSFPHKGPVPDDVVHLLVELELGMKRGFWGLVAAGHHPDEIGAMAKAGGHASAVRSNVPVEAIVQAVQAERIVECFEADLWSGGSDLQSFTEALHAAFEQSLVPSLLIDADAIMRIRKQLTQFQDRWSATPVEGSCALEWPDEPAHA